MSYIETNHFREDTLTHGLELRPYRRSRTGRTLIAAVRNGLNVLASLFTGALR